MPDQGQTETEAAMGARAGAVALAEPVEDVGQDRGIDRSPRSRLRAVARVCSDVSEALSSRSTAFTSARAVSTPPRSTAARCCRSKAITAMAENAIIGRSMASAKTSR